MDPVYEASRPGGVEIFEEALRGSLFERLARAVRSIGDERLKRNYTTTFWFPKDTEPTNVAEQTIIELQDRVGSAKEWIGTEWWIGRLAYGEKLRFHFDRDMTIKKRTGKYAHPLRASVLYLNTFPSSPTVILDQIPSPDGKSRVPEKPKFRTSVEAIPNRYVVFPGNLRHGVIPDSKHVIERATSRKSDTRPSELRLTLLINFWDRRPLPPVCFDYDGSIYSKLQD